MIGGELRRRARTEWGREEGVSLANFCTQLFAFIFYQGAFPGPKLGPEGGYFVEWDFLKSPDPGFPKLDRAIHRINHYIECYLADKY